MIFTNLKNYCIHEYVKRNDETLPQEAEGVSLQSLSEEELVEMVKMAKMIKEVL
jgi:hypothetical protein